MKPLGNSALLKSVYHLGRRVLRRTGRDIFRLDALESLRRELEHERANRPPSVDALEAVVDALKGSIDQERRARLAYQLEKNIVPLRSERFSYKKNVNSDELLIFTASEPSDFDWLEWAIFSFGYYEKLGCWSFTIDEDKRTLAEMIATFKPRKTLDFGCANGPLVQALADLRVHSEGVEISSFALENAFPGIKERIHHGDILSLRAGAEYDVISGLDIFEHLNPNKIDVCLEKISELLAPGGVVFANIPAFGTDEVFGEVFPYYMRAWDEQRDGSSYFKEIHCDMHGYPVNGHLIWADTKWWTRLFEQHGLMRNQARERELHANFGHRLYHSRKSLYVFEKVRGAQR